MEEKTVACEYCGAICRESDSYCKDCSHSLTHAVSEAEPAINGIEDRRLTAYLDKHADYYLAKFKKSKTQRLPFQLNIAALLFGQFWFFYRKISTVAVTYSAAMIILTLLLHGLVPVLFAPTVDHFFEVRESYMEYSDYIHNELSLDYTQTTPTADKLRAQLHVACDQIRMIDRCVSFAPFPIQLVVALLANTLYKKHIIKTINRSSGGVSLGNTVAAAVVLIGLTVLLAVLLYQIPAVFRFQDAMQKLVF